MRWSVYLYRQLKSYALVLVALCLFVAAWSLWIVDRQNAIHRECREELRRSFAEMSAEMSKFTQIDGQRRLRAVEKAVKELQSREGGP